MPENAKRRPAKGGASVCNTRCAAGARQAHSAALERVCLSCAAPGVTGLCGTCDAEAALERLASVIAEQAAALAAEAGPSAPCLPVRDHLKPKPSQLWTRAEFGVALEWERRPERGHDGWWFDPAYALPALYAEAFATWRQAQ